MRVTSDMDWDQVPNLLTTAEVAVLLGKSQGAVQELLRREKIKGKKFGGEYRIRKCDLEAEAV